MVRRTRTTEQRYQRLIESLDDETIQAIKEAETPNEIREIVPRWAANQDSTLLGKQRLLQSYYRRIEQADIRTLERRMPQRVAQTREHWNRIAELEQQVQAQQQLIAEQNQRLEQITQQIDQLMQQMQRALEENERLRQQLQQREQQQTLQQQYNAALEQEMIVVGATDDTPLSYISEANYMFRYYGNTKIERVDSANPAALIDEVERRFDPDSAVKFGVAVNYRNDQGSFRSYKEVSADEFGTLVDLTDFIDKEIDSAGSRYNNSKIASYSVYQIS